MKTFVQFLFVSLAGFMIGNPKIAQCGRLVLPAPQTTITSFAPASGPIGITVTISGTDLDQVTDVQFNGVSAVSPKIGATIKAKVPVGATTGPITLVYSGGTIVSVTNFTICTNGSTLTLNTWQGPVGSSVVIYGQGFSTIASSNLVYFGDAKAVVTNATIYQLTVTVPAGADYSLVSVINASTSTSRFTQYSIIPFLTTFSSKKSLSANDFNPEVAYSTGTCPSGYCQIAKKSAIGDIDIDGKPDMVAVHNGGNVFAFRNTSTVGSIASSSFSTKVQVASGATDVLLQDLNLDGKPELIIGSSSGVTIFPNMNSATFGTGNYPTSFNLPLPGSTAFSFIQLATADFNRDGNTDLAAVYDDPNGGFSGRKIVVIQNNSTFKSLKATTFGAAFEISNTPSSTNLIPSKLLAVDIDGDNRMDLAAAGGGVSMFRNKYDCGVAMSAASFEAELRLDGFRTFDLAFSDFNNDQKPDLIAGSYGADTMAVLYQNTSTSGSLGIGSFSNRINLLRSTPAGAGISKVASDDLDGDGNPDLIITNDGVPFNLSVFRNKGTGIFSSAMLEASFDLVESGAPQGITLSDMDLDGKVDIVLSNYADNVSVIRNKGNDPYCNPSTVNGCFAGEFGNGYINGITLTEIATGNNQILSSNTYCSGGYEYFPQNPGTIKTGTTYNLIYDLVHESQGVAMWIDFNKDSDFDDVGEMLVSAYQTEVIGSGSLIIPFNVSSLISSGSYRMRVRTSAYKVNASAFQSNEACIPLIGECEDYLINITNYCIPSYTQSCVLGGGTGSYNSINSVSYTTLSSYNAGCNGNRDNYIYLGSEPTFANRKAVVKVGSTNSLSISVNQLSQIGVWIDYNNDKTFATTEFVASSSTAARSFAFPITTPTTAKFGICRMRIRTRNGTALTATDACNTLSGYGETEDYDVEFVVNPGTVTSGNQTICNGASPSTITVSNANPSAVRYSWYYKDGLATQPIENVTDGWTFLFGELGTNYYTPAAITSNRTYACFVKPSSLTVPGAWADGVRQVTVLPVFNPGTIASGDQSGCAAYDPNPVTLSWNPTGSGAYSYKWYYWGNSTMACPSGSAIPSGGTSSPTDTRYFGTSPDGSGISFDPSSSGTGTGRTWAVYITPVSNGAVPACGTPQWASTCRKTAMVNCSVFNPGTIQIIWQRVCYNSQTGAIAFSVAPSGAASYTYQWYVSNGIVSSPTGSTIPVGWTPVTGQTSATMASQTGLTGDKTYACFVTPNTGTGAWAVGYMQYQVMPQPNTGTLQAGDQVLTSPASPATINFANLPVGSDAYFYQWFEKAGPNSAPTGTAFDPTWNSVQGPSTTSSYTPPAGQTITKSFACYVTSNGGINCNTVGWASGVRLITVNPAVSFNPGTVAAGNQTICNGAVPNQISCTGSTAGSTFAWFYQNGPVAAPANTAPIGSWQPVNPAGTLANYTTAALTTTRTFACRVTNGGSAQWATGVRLVTVLPVFNPGTIAAGDQSLCANGNPAPITMSVAPVGSGSFTYTWWYKNSVVACPTGNTIAGWLQAASTTNSYDPQSASTAGRTFTVLVTPGGTPTCGTAAFANSCRKITVVAPPCSNSRVAVDVESEMDPSQDGEADLAQNIPNPFQSESVISCFIPSESRSSSIEIFGLDGRKLQQIPISGTGAQEVFIDRKHLPNAGIYMYSLVIDGQTQSVKRMVITN